MPRIFFSAPVSNTKRHAAHTRTGTGTQTASRSGVPRPPNRIFGRFAGWLARVRPTFMGCANVVDHQPSLVRGDTAKPESAVPDFPLTKLAISDTAITSRAAKIAI